MARTRLRQEGNIYRGFWQTLNKVLKDEGVQGLYRGLTAQLVRAIPNCAIMMCTYELTVYALTPHRPHTDSDNTIDIWMRHSANAQGLIGWLVLASHLLLDDFFFWVLTHQDISWQFSFGAFFSLVRIHCGLCFLWWDSSTHLVPKFCIYML